jgi:arsenite methyltransferase
MALKSPTGFKTDKLREEIRDVYSRVANSPDGDFHFHRGPEYAASHLGYDKAELDQLPVEVTASFAGIGNPLVIGEILPGEVVADLGCGTGMDLFLAARRVGTGGRAIGIDMTPAMLTSATRSAESMGAAQVDIRQGDLLTLPIEDASVDVVISNGVFNLVPDKVSAFSEVGRVLKPGGRLYLADIIMSSELDEASRGDIDLWTG